MLKLFILKTEGEIAFDFSKIIQIQNASIVYYFLRAVKNLIYYLQLQNLD